jgi:hypothetical protein
MFWPFCAGSVQNGAAASAIGPGRFYGFGDNAILVRLRVRSGPDRENDAWQ